jgi:mono/diheme cytochrome c family protein
MKNLRLSITVLLSIGLLAGCLQEKPSKNPPIHLNPNMDDQPKYEAMEESRFWTDRSVMRIPVEGTVARGQLNEDPAYFEGKNPDGSFLKKSPVKIDIYLLKRGQERFNIFCSPCHDRTGYGQGIIVKKGFLPAPSFHLDRLRQAEDGYIFDVITKGIRNMPSYKYQVPVPDRWAIVAYIRALQRSQNATLTDIPEKIRQTLK